jgi:hypothetical protein
VISADGKKATGARFGMQGRQATGELQLQAAKLWDNVARDVSVFLEVPGVIDNVEIIFAVSMKLWRLSNGENGTEIENIAVLYSVQHYSNC